MKRIGIIALVFGILVLVGATAIAPSIMAWRYSAPVEQGRSAIVSCANEMKFAMHAIIETQIFGLLTGLVLGAVVGFVTRKKPAPEATPAAAPAPEKKA